MANADCRALIGHSLNKRHIGKPLKPVTAVYRIKNMSLPPVLEGIDKVDPGLFGKASFTPYPSFILKHQ
jgi:hypothetical protein